MIRVEAPMLVGVCRTGQEISEYFLTQIVWNLKITLRCRERLLSNPGINSHIRESSLAREGHLLHGHTLKGHSLIVSPS
jgi:hypothetical protein